jgi:hypothetical protein
MHKELEQKYKDADFDYNIDLHPNDKNEFIFFQKVKIAKKPVIHNITKVVRIKIGNDEHVYYHETLRSRDYLNNMIDHSHVVGKYEDPQFLTSVDPKTDTPRQTEIQGYETIYQFTWTPNIIDIWLSQDGFQLDEGCGYIAIQGGKKYGGYTYEQFCEFSYDDLITFGKFGTLEPKAIEQVRKKQLRSIQDNAR